MHPKARVVAAPAKINLYLAVGSLRQDGYHDVETVLQAISVYDRVVLEPADDISVSTDVDLGIADEDNLAYRAASLLATEADVHVGARITLHKNIPAGSGLGGGSSDAAATLVGLADLWDLPPDVDLEGLATDLGVDVPFFLHGGTAHLSGRGDVLRHRLPTPDITLAVLKPPSSLSTVAAYRAFDAFNAGRSPAADIDMDAVIEDISSGDPDRIAAALHNDLTQASLSLEPRIADAMALCEGMEGVLGTLMSGSGSGVFCVCADEGVASRVRDDARARGWWAEVARAVDHGVRVHIAEEAM